MVLEFSPEPSDSKSRPRRSGPVAIWSEPPGAAQTSWDCQQTIIKPGEGSTALAEVSPVSQGEEAAVRCKQDSRTEKDPGSAGRGFWEGGLHLWDPLGYGPPGQRW